jgi:hypothetical protein
MPAPLKLNCVWPFGMPAPLKPLDTVTNRRLGFKTSCEKICIEIKSAILRKTVQTLIGEVFHSLGL